MIEKDLQKLLNYVAVRSSPARPYIFGVRYTPPESDAHVGTWYAAVGHEPGAPDAEATALTPVGALSELAASIPDGSPRSLRVVHTSTAPLRSQPFPSSGHVPDETTRDPEPFNPYPPPARPAPWPGFASPTRPPVTTRRYDPDPDGPDGHVRRTFNPDPANFSPDEE